MRWQFESTAGICWLFVQSIAAVNKLIDSLFPTAFDILKNNIFEIIQFTY